MHPVGEQNGMLGHAGGRRGRSKVLGAWARKETRSPLCGPSNQVLWFNSSQALFSIEIHWVCIHAHLPIHPAGVPCAKCHEGFVWAQQRPWKCIAPVNT